MSGGDVVDPIVQVLGCKKIQSSNTDNNRFRILMSDGNHTISFAMLTTKINDSVGKDGIPQYTIIKIKKFVTNILNNAGNNRGNTYVN